MTEFPMYPKVVLRVGRDSNVTITQDYLYSQSCRRHRDLRVAEYAKQYDLSEAVALAVLQDQIVATQAREDAFLKEIWGDE